MAKKLRVRVHGRPRRWVVSCSNCGVLNAFHRGDSRFWRNRAAAEYDARYHRQLHED